MTEGDKVCWRFYNNVLLVVQLHIMYIWFNAKKKNLYWIIFYWIYVEKKHWRVESVRLLSFFFHFWNWNELNCVTIWSKEWCVDFLWYFLIRFWVCWLVFSISIGLGEEKKVSYIHCCVGFYFALIVMCLHWCENISQTFYV